MSLFLHLKPTQVARPFVLQQPLYRPFSSSIIRPMKHIRLGVPQPTTEIPDVETFLTKIGRNSTEHLGVFESDWSKFFSMTSKQMKDSGIDVRSRKYILDWQQKFKSGIPLGENKLPVKKNGGERQFKVYTAQKIILERIKQAQLQKAYRKAHTQEVVQKKQWNRLHKKLEQKQK